MDVTKTTVIRQNPASSPEGKGTTSQTTNSFSDTLTSVIDETKPSTPATLAKEPIEYIVKKGDTLWSIGRHQFHVDPNQIARDNRLADPNLLRPGQKLIITPSASPPRPK